MILTLLIRSVIPAGFMPSMDGHAAMMNCPGMEMMQQQGDKPVSHRPCLFASEFITGKAVDIIHVPAPQVLPVARITFIAEAGLFSVFIDAYQSRGPPVSFPV